MSRPSGKPDRKPAVTADEVLVTRARDGDESAFRELLERYGPTLKARIRRRLPAALRRKVSESDVLQVAYLGAFQNLSGFEARGDGAFKAWLAQIVDHKIKDLLRRYVASAKRSVRSEVSRPGRVETRNVPGRTASPSEHAMATELEQKVHASMTALPDHYRMILRLVQEEGLTLAEAGRRMGRSAKASEKLYGRALSRLSDLVHGKAESGDD
ncbi:MAG: RNA polymerase sigma factor [Planctomycetota bacterium]|jgi:RNA polymerase sigma-70 factor (ECF subfamily)